MRPLALALALLAALPALAETRLMMVEQVGCHFCLQWDAEVGDAYAATREGRAAPLWRVDIGDLPVAGGALDRRVLYTPTFVLIVDGAERDRIEGYPGEDFFYGLLGRMLDALPAGASG